MGETIDLEGQKIARAGFLRQTIEKGGLDREGIAALIKSSHSDFKLEDLYALATQLRLENTNLSNKLLAELRGASIILSQVE